MTINNKKRENEIKVLNEVIFHLESSIEAVYKFSGKYRLYEVSGKV